MTFLHMDVWGNAPDSDFITPVMDGKMCEYCFQSDFHHYACPASVSARRDIREKKYYQISRMKVVDEWEMHMNGEVTV